MRTLHSYVCRKLLRAVHGSVYTSFRIVLFTATCLPTRRPQVIPIFSKVALANMIDWIHPDDRGRAVCLDAETGELYYHDPHDQYERHTNMDVNWTWLNVPEDEQIALEQSVHNGLVARNKMLCRQERVNRRVRREYEKKRRERRMDRRRGGSLFPKRRGDWSYSKALCPAIDDHSYPFWWPVPWWTEPWAYDIPEVPMAMVSC